MTARLYCNYRRKRYNHTVCLKYPLRLIGERVGHAARLHQQNAPESSAGLTACSQDGAGYLANSNRFHTDTCGEEFALRQGGIERRRQVDELKREIAVSREEARWQQMEEEKVLLILQIMSFFYLFFMGLLISFSFLISFCRGSRGSVGRRYERM